MVEIANVISNLHRVYLIKEISGNMAADIDSIIVDIKDMPITFFQAIWTGVNVGGSGSLELEVSAFDDANTMSPYPASIRTFPESPSKKSLSWNIGFSGFRYARVLYRKGTITQGTLYVVGIGKKSG